MRTSERVAARLEAILSVVLGIWGLVVMPFPFAVVGGAGAAVCGLVLGVLALLTPAWGRWRKAAFVGIAISCLALLVLVGEIVFFVFFG
jgi:hypothetical protein